MEKAKLCTKSKFYITKSIAVKDEAGVNISITRITKNCYLLINGTLIPSIADKNALRFSKGNLEG